MASLFEQVNVNTEGVVDGVLTSAAFTITATRQTTLSLNGEFDKAIVVLEVSTYNNGSADVYQPHQVYRGPKVETFILDETIKVRVVARGLTTASSITVTTGGGNT